MGSPMFSTWLRPLGKEGATIAQVQNLFAVGKWPGFICRLHWAIRTYSHEK